MLGMKLSDYNKRFQVLTPVNAKTTILACDAV